MASTIICYLLKIEVYCVGDKFGGFFSVSFTNLGTFQCLQNKLPNYLFSCAVATLNISILLNLFRLLTSDIKSCLFKNMCQLYFVLL